MSDKPSLKNVHPDVEEYDGDIYFIKPFGFCCESPWDYITDNGEYPHYWNEHSSSFDAIEYYLEDRGWRDILNAIQSKEKENARLKEMAAAVDASLLREAGDDDGDYALVVSKDYADSFELKVKELEKKLAHVESEYAKEQKITEWYGAEARKRVKIGTIECIGFAADMWGERARQRIKERKEFSAN